MKQKTLQNLLFNEIVNNKKYTLNLKIYWFKFIKKKVVFFYNRKNLKINE